MKNTITRPQYGTLTQGYLFTCAETEDYSGCEVYGLVITARCDVAHDKAQVFNYIPVVTLDDWIHRDGKRLLLERIRNDSEQQARNQLKQCKFSPNILDTLPLEKVLDTLFKDNNLSKAEKAAKDKLILIRDKLDHVEEIGSSNDSRRFVMLANNHGSHRDTLISELTNQRLNGYYFLPCVEHNGSDSGYVIRLREVQRIPRVFAEKIAIGLSREDYVTLSTDDPRLNGPFNFSRAELAMPVGCISSPILEHIMQSFSSLFCRIGLPDLDPKYIATLWEKQCSVMEL